MQPQNCSATHKLKLKSIPILKLQPQNFDWRNQGIVSPVKNQQNCGSCWTFSTVAAIESHWNLLKRGKNATFSQQQILDCAGDYDNYGCQGGLPSHAFQYIKYAPGLMPQQDYPYQGVDGHCRYQRAKVRAFVPFGSYNITQNDQIEAKQRLLNAGPISVAFQVVQDFQNYLQGVYHSSECRNTTMDVNHAVLAVGYGIQNGRKYWIVKNSWGKTWGNQGFFWIQRQTNMCGIGVCNSYPLIQNKQLQQFQLIQ